MSNDDVAYWLHRAAARQEYGAQLQQFTDEVLHQLGLAPVRDTPVRDTVPGGVCGGE